MSRKQRTPRIRGSQGPQIGIGWLALPDALQALRVLPQGTLAPTEEDTP